MRIHIEQLQEGCILSKNLVSATDKPIAYNKTVINQHIKAALQAFLIKEVEVENFLVNGEKFQPAYFLDENEKEIEETVEDVVEKTFYQLYIEAVNILKQLYLSWQSGASLDIAKVRQVIIPLVDLLKDHEEEVIKLYHNTKEKDYIYHHSISVALLSALLGVKLNYKQGDINQIALTGLLCDCGMSKIPPTILTKHVPLTENEYRDVKKHPIHSYHLLKNIMSIKEGVRIGVLQHHERMDGSGYPLGVKGDKLHPYSKIVALADTYQAMVSIRPYRSKQSPFKVLEQIMQDGFGKFDLNIVNELKKIIIKFSVDTKVKLSNGKEAVIVFIDEQNPTRPIVKSTQTGEIIPLKDKSELFIEYVL